MPFNFSKAVFKFLQLPDNTVHCSVIGKRANRGAGYGLEILVTYTLREPQKAIKWVKKAVTRELKLTNDMKKKPSK